MLYAVLIYNAEAELGELTKADLDGLIARHERVQEQLAAEGKLGPVVRLMSTSTATTLRPGRNNVITDGPFAETKEQLLGFYVVDCATVEEAQDAARLIGGACNARTLEVRPVGLFYPGGDIKAVKTL
ncbi:MAG TPA: YciI family protein [Povalibacter sp.]